MAERYCKACDGWHDLSEPWPIRCVSQVTPSRSPLPFPMVISDTMDALEHVDGKFYTSKSSFRAVTRARGYVEVGTEKLKPFQRKSPDRQAIKDSLHRAKAALS